MTIIDNPTISNHVDRLPRTEFGAPILDDYGQDDLARYNVDLTEHIDRDLRLSQQIDDLLGRQTAHKREQQLLVAVFDPKAPAKPSRRSLYEDWAVEISRQPDSWEDGQAWWIGEHGVVGYDFAHWSKALSIVEDHGSQALRGILPDAYGLTVIPHYEGLWATQAFIKPETNHAYMLWTIAQSTLSN